MTVFTPLIGRLGNKLFQYCYARAYAEKLGAKLVTPPWEGEELFDIPISNADSGDTVLTGYHQDQDSLIYTRSQVKEWLKFKKPIVPIHAILCHRRVGDYAAAGYVVVSEKSYYDAMRKFYLYNFPHEFVTEENSTQGPLEDFKRLASCSVLFRGNSSFSWWAATLGNGLVYSPVIEGLKGGKEQDCEFVEGNWPRLANLAFTTDLHLAP